MTTNFLSTISFYCSLLSSISHCIKMQSILWSQHTQCFSIPRQVMYRIETTTLDCCTSSSCFKDGGSCKCLDAFMIKHLCHTHTCQRICWHGSLQRPSSFKMSQNSWRSVTRWRTNPDGENWTNHRWLWVLKVSEFLRWLSAVSPTVNGHSVFCWKTCRTRFPNSHVIGLQT